MGAMAHRVEGPPRVCAASWEGPGWVPLGGDWWWERCRGRGEDCRSPVSRDRGEGASMGGIPAE